MLKDILIVKEPESGCWACGSSTGVSGNQTLQTVVERIENSMRTQSDKPWDFYLWDVEGKLWGDDNKLVEECDRWHLSRYEICPAPSESKYQAVIILYYEPAPALAVAG
jgi:hypothetical protein